jgi:hypothetical protein
VITVGLPRRIDKHFHFLASAKRFETLGENAFERNGFHPTRGGVDRCIGFYRRISNWFTFRRLTRTRQSDDKVKKHLCLGRHMVSGRMIRIERKALIRPVCEKVDEPPFPNQRLGSKQ